VTDAEFAALADEVEEGIRAGAARTVYDLCVGLSDEDGGRLMAEMVARGAVPPAT
jgi:hypothetical protein